MAKPTPGLKKRGNVWHIQKSIAGIKLYESTGEAELEQAERYLAKRTAEIRSVKIYGDKIEKTFDAAAARFIEEYEHKRSIDRDIDCLKSVIPYIGHLELKMIHIGALQNYIKDRKAAGISASTITRDLAVIRRVLNLSARLWRDEQGRPWLDTVPMLPAIQGAKRKPRPITINEQSQLMRNMPSYLADMTLFALHTGLRDQELCSLRWENERSVSGLNTSVFIIIEEDAKNEYERIVPLNSVALSIVEKYRGQSEFVFNLNGKRLERMNNRAWRKAREAVGLKNVRVHDLRHTFGMRLRAAGVGIEDRADLLGHHNGRITTHYSKVEIARLIECVNLLCENDVKPELTLIRRTG